MTPRAPKIRVVTGGADDIPEPDWTWLIPDRADESNERQREAAHRYWQSITEAMRQAGTLAPENGPQVKRLVVAYARYDVASYEVWTRGAVLDLGLPTQNRWVDELRAADSDALRAELALCLPPKHRAGAGKPKRSGKPGRASDAYLRPVP